MGALVVAGNINPSEDESRLNFSGVPWPQVVNT
jgi:hypothetical protein